MHYEWVLVYRCEQCGASFTKTPKSGAKPAPAPPSDAYTEGGLLIILNHSVRADHPCPVAFPPLSVARIGIGKLVGVENIRIED